MIAGNRTLASMAAAIGILVQVSSPGMAQAESYVKLTCKAVTTPLGSAVVFTPVLTMYFPASETAPFPTLFELRDQNPVAFNYMNKQCNANRYLKTTFPNGVPPDPVPPPNPPDVPPVWPNWWNDRKYEKIDIAEVINPSPAPRLCAEPCLANSQCTSGVCSPLTHSCVCNNNCVGAPDGLDHWWPFDETSGTSAQDIAGGRTGNTNPGPIGGTGPASAAGMVNNAFEFNGSSTFVEVPDGPGTLSYGNPGDNFSIDAWVMVQPRDSSGLLPIVDKRVEIGDSVSGYELFLSDGRLGLQMADAIGSGHSCRPGSTCTNYISPSTNPSIADGFWHLVAVTVQRPSVVNLYVDGIVVLTSTPRMGSFNNAPLLIASGYPIAVTKPYFKGWIDELEIFNRALTLGEVQEIVNAGSAGKCK